jgi:hypothetical protein
MKIDKADSLSADDRLGTVLAACLETVDRGAGTMTLRRRHQPTVFP